MITPFIISLWAAIAFTIYFQEYARLHLKIRVRGCQPFNRKPFNCETCLPFWLTAVFLLFAIYVRASLQAIAALALACTAGIITERLISYLRK